MLFAKIRSIISHVKWAYSNYDVPAPHHIKFHILKRQAIPHAEWIETGTYLGHMAHKLAKYFPFVHTIEPDIKIYETTKERLHHIKNIRFYHGTSENTFSPILETLHGSVNIWLDGHFSGGTKYKTYKGNIDCPISHELASIEKNINKFDTIVCFIDDMRMFTLENRKNGYLSKDDLVQWCQRLQLSWTIQHDIFIAKKFKSIARAKRVANHGVISSS